MRVTVRPGGQVGGYARVPGDKSIGHRWLILGATAEGRCELRGLPAALDVRSTARILAVIAQDETRASLERWASSPTPPGDGERSTGNEPEPRPGTLVLEARGRGGLQAPGWPLDCGNSGTTMRLVAGLLACRPFASVLVGDASLSRRPMERVAEPLREMGADVRTTDGHAPVTVSGAALHGIRHVCTVPSAQVKSAVLLAALAAEGPTTLQEPAATRDHTERALEALGAPIHVSPGSVTVEAYRHPGFAGTVPGDVSGAAFLIGAAALTGSELTIGDVGLNPTRTAFLSVLERMGVRTRAEIERSEVGEPVGHLVVEACRMLRGTEVTEGELPLVIDEVPLLAMVAAHAVGSTRFRGAGELRVKESDRLAGPAEAIGALGGEAAVEGEDLVVAGGGLRGGRASAGGDHRMAMALAVAALAAGGAVEIDGMEAAEVSFPGFVSTLMRLGARLEP
ncbi:MAG TPA: 3-phosphoshikimate 1-carboxyvinyltransferase [Actinomycetota bacterium]